MQTPPEESTCRATSIPASSFRRLEPAAADALFALSIQVADSRAVALSRLTAAVNRECTNVERLALASSRRQSVDTERRSLRSGGREPNAWRDIVAGALLTVAPAMAIAISGSYLPGGAPVDTRIFPESGSVYSGVAWLGGCSGVAIAPSIVLTAAHCSGVTYAQFPQFNANQDYSRSIYRSINRFVPFPSYDVTSQRVQPHDIALAFLDGALPDEVRTYRLGTFATANELLGQGATFAGFGRTMAGLDATAAPSSTGAPDFAPQLRGGVNRLDRLSSDGRVFLTDFDGAGRDSFRTPGYGPLEVGTTQGDSGSGVFWSATAAFETHCLINPASGGCPGTGVFTKPLSDEPFVVGITSYSQFPATCREGDIACMNRFGTADGYTFVGGYLGWIASVVRGQVAFAEIVPQFADLQATSTFEFNASDFIFVPPEFDNSGSVVPLPSTFTLLLVGCSVAQRCRATKRFNSARLSDYPQRKV